VSARLDAALAQQFAGLALACVEREFPYQPAHAIRSPADVHRPHALHPAFYGCYDWHSAVHGHWLLVHLLRRFPALAQAAAIRKVLDAHLSERNLRQETAYLEEHPAFERPYGWAWLLRLAHELAGWKDADATRWRANLKPLAALVEELYLDWLPRQHYPIRAGTHASSAFGLAFALDYAQAAKRRDLEAAIREKAQAWYGADRDYPAAWEPGGNDFLSPCLVEADLMRRVVPDFGAWFAAFLPALPAALAQPALVTDRNDGQLAHLDGLNLSRAACGFNLARALPGRKDLAEAAERHLAEGLRHVASGSYAGEHWLASFAAWALQCAAAR
jgi:hypothetical protein